MKKIENISLTHLFCITIQEIISLQLHLVLKPFKCKNNVFIDYAPFPVDRVRLHRGHLEEFNFIPNSLCNRNDLI